MRTRQYVDGKPVWSENVPAAARAQKFYLGSTIEPLPTTRYRGNEQATRAKWYAAHKAEAMEAQRAYRRRRRGLIP